MSKPKDGDRVMRDNTRFAFFHDEGRAKLPADFRITLTPRSIADRLKRIRLQTND